MALDTSRAAVVWEWLLDPRHPVAGLVADDAELGLVGIAHYRPFPRPLSATTGCFLDDLFVSPHARGRGVATVLLEHLAQLAADHGRSVVRWITAADNQAAQHVYDRAATRTSWVTYDLAPRPSEPAP